MKVQIFIVCHFFGEAEKTEINLAGEYEIVNSLYNENCTVRSGVLSIFGHDRSAVVLKLYSK